MTSKTRWELIAVTKRKGETKGAMAYDAPLKQQKKTSKKSLRYEPIKKKAGGWKFHTIKT